MGINARLDRPGSPGSWVDNEQCHACGAQYRNFNSGVTWSDGLDDFKSLNTDGFKSRGPVLWAMHCRKLTLWYARHAYCGQLLGVG